MAQGRSLSSLFVQALAERGGWPLSAIVGFPFAAHLFQWPEEELCHAPVETIDLGESAPRQVLSGLAQHMSLEQVKGADVVCICNLKARKIAVMLCGMLAPPNYGADYAARFNSIYPDLAKQFDVPLYPFFLEGVAADAKLNQADGIHPTAAGVDIIVGNIMPTMEAFLGPIAEQRR